MPPQALSPSPCPSAQSARSTRYRLRCEGRGSRDALWGQASLCSRLTPRHGTWRLHVTSSHVLRAQVGAAERRCWTGSNSCFAGSYGPCLRAEAQWRTIAGGDGEAKARGRSGAPLQEGMEKARCSKATATPDSRRNMSTLDSTARPRPMCSRDLRRAKGRSLTRSESRASRLESRAS